MDDWTGENSFLTSSYVPCSRRSSVHPFPHGAAHLCTRDSDFHMSTAFADDVLLPLPPPAPTPTSPAAQLAEKQRHVSLTPVEQMLSSAVGAMATSLIVTPFDVVKTRMQVSQSSTLNTIAANVPEPSARTASRVAHVGAAGLGMATPHLAVCGHCHPVYILRNGLMDHVCLVKDCFGPLTQTTAKISAAQYTSTYDALATIRRNEGIFALWRGLPPTLAMAIPLTVMYFTAYDQLSDHLGRANPTTPVVAGSIARTVSVIAVSPAEMVRTKIQATSTGSYSDLVSMLRGAIKTEGFRSLWRGVEATLLRDVPFSAIYWTGYERIKSCYRARLKILNPNSEVPISVAFVAGASSGSLAAALTLPFDVIKTHQQTQLGSDIINSSESGRIGRSTASSATETFNSIVRSQGVRGLFVGLTPRVAKVAPSCAIMISSYEFMKDYFRNKQLDQL